MTRTARRGAYLALAVAIAVGVFLLRAPLVAWFSGEPAGQPEPGAAATTAKRAADAAAPGEPAGPALPAVVLPERALVAVRDAFEAYEVTRALLARDQAGGLAAPATTMAGALRAAASALGSSPPAVASTLDQAIAAAERLAGATSLEDGREAFAELGRSLVALAASDPRLQQGWHLFRCPMTEGFNKWFQRAPALENPYMGRAMLTCGSATEWSAAPPAPPGEAGASHAGHGHAGDDPAFYTCPMHPSVRQSQPGTCPLCGMTLTPVTYAEQESGVVVVDAGRRQLLGVTTAKAVREAMTLEIRAVGRLTYDETRLHDVTLKLKGWISKLHVEATGQPVRKGQVLFTLYSPELHAAQQEYLLALRSQRDGAAAPGAAGRSDYLVRAAEKKLRLWDLTPSQIAAIARRGEPIEDVPILSPAGGFVIEKEVIEGAAVEPGQRLFRIAALDRVWAEARLYEGDLAHVRKGQTASVSLAYLPGKPLEGVVAYVYPYLDPQTRTGRVRVELANQDLALRPDMYATVSFRVELGEKLQVPLSAVLYTGPRRLVFVDLGEGRLRPQEVVLGPRTAERVAIESGLEAGQTVVTSGNFLVAAESRLRSASPLWAEERAGAGEAAHGGH